MKNKTTIERIEREAVNEASMINAEPWIRREVHITISRKMQSERNTTLDEVIELLRNEVNIMDGEDLTTIISDLNKMKV